MATKPVTCIDVPITHTQTYLDHFMYFIREGDEIRIETVNHKNGKIFTKAVLTPAQFKKLTDAVLAKPGD